jgi:predicted acylesterase/phospholipase RssA
MPAALSLDGSEIGLCLSGGGFRATFFHLGVLRLLRDVGLLPQVRIICSVSGASILAAHTCLNWENYCTAGLDDDPFFAISAELARLGMSDVRGRAVRRAALRALIGRGTVTPMLERQYAALFGGAQLADLSATAPELHMLATSMSTGELVDFSSSGVSVCPAGPASVASARTYPASSLPLATAVAASSAFPPLFRPVQITREDLHAQQSEFPHTQYLTDGGVFDNLGSHRMTQLLGGRAERMILLLSDASSGFDWNLRQRRWGVITRNVRASDILMGRVADLEARAVADSVQPVLRASIHDVVRDSDVTLEAEYQPQDVDFQRACRFLRTDLDAFSLEEISALVRHGYETTLSAVQDAVSPPRDKTAITDPCPFGWPFRLDIIQLYRALGRFADILVEGGNKQDRDISAAYRQVFGTPMTDEQRQAVEEEKQDRAKAAAERRSLVEHLERGSRRHVRLWDSADPASWALLLLALALLAAVLALIVLT